MSEMIALKALLKIIEFDGGDCCPMCGGNSTHDSACVLAAFLYPENAEAFKRQTRSTHIAEMLWRVNNDKDMKFLHGELEVKTRQENVEIVESLYGLDEDDVKDLLEIIGFQALSDEAVEMLAERQQARERRYCNQEPVVNMGAG